MTLNPFKWWRQRKERKRLEALGTRSETWNDVKPECDCGDCSCSKVERRGGLVRSPASSRVIGGSGYVPSPSRRVIGRSRQYSNPCGESEPIYFGDSDLIDPVDALIAAQIITNRFGQDDPVDDQPEVKGGFTIPDAPAKIEPAYFDDAPKERSNECGSTGCYEAPAIQERVEECGSTGCFNSEPDTPDTNSND